mmetsp:Transcript_21183/g.29955  ORF Transcript_21183/g.29955 Transcript_21183/m.29955 type:complete len:242 (-) Transcript_21183:274-999(-)
MTAQEGSWRDTLYVWDGILTITDNDDTKEDSSNKDTTVSWEGTWVGCENCADAKKAEAPKRGVFDAFVESDMHFLVEGTATKVDQTATETTPNSNGHKVPYQASFLKGEGWDLQEDDGKTKSKHKDKVHDVYFANLEWSGNLRDQRSNLIFAKGSNDHGSFISAGWMRPGNRVTLGRRYLDDNDPRAKWDLDELRQAVLKEVLQQGRKIHLPPWQCGALHSIEQDMSMKKRKLEEDDKAKQ